MNMNIEQYCGAVTSARFAFRLVNQKSFATSIPASELTKSEIKFTI